MSLEDMVAEVTAAHPDLLVRLAAEYVSIVPDLVGNDRIVLVNRTNSYGERWARTIGVYADERGRNAKNAKWVLHLDSPGDLARSSWGPYAEGYEAYEDQS
jgi:hypothetical protein